MIQKILLILCVFVSFFFVSDIVSAAGCNYDGTGDIWAALDGCVSGSDFVKEWDYTVEGGFKNLVNKWIRAIAGVLGLFAVGAIVYGALLMTLSAGEDEKIKKWKDIVKWSIIGFLGVVTAWGLIAILVNFIFAIS